MNVCPIFFPPPFPKPPQFRRKGLSPLSLRAPDDAAFLSIFPPRVCVSFFPEPLQALPSPEEVPNVVTRPVHSRFFVTGVIPFSPFLVWIARPFPLVLFTIPRASMAVWNYGSPTCPSMRRISTMPESLRTSKIFVRASNTSRFPATKAPRSIRFFPLNGSLPFPSSALLGFLLDQLFPPCVSHFMKLGSRRGGYTPDRAARLAFFLVDSPLPYPLNQLFVVLFYIDNAFLFCLGFSD